jgi:hypothetical protein
MPTSADSPTKNRVGPWPYGPGANPCPSGMPGTVSRLVPGHRRLTESLADSPDADEAVTGAHRGIVHG